MTLIAQHEGFRGMARWSDRALLAESLLGREAAGDLLWARHESAAADVVRVFTGIPAGHAALSDARDLFDAEAAALVWAGMPVREAVVTLAARALLGDGADVFAHDYPAARTSLVEAHRLMTSEERTMLWFHAVEGWSWSDCVPMVTAQAVADAAPTIVERFLELWIAVSRGRGLPDECARERVRLLLGRGEAASPLHGQSCMPCAAVIVNRDAVIDRLGTLLLASAVGSEAAEHLRADAAARSAGEVITPPVWR